MSPVLLQVYLSISTSLSYQLPCTCLGPENINASLGSVAIVYSCKSFVRLCKV